MKQNIESVIATAKKAGFQVKEVAVKAMYFNSFDGIIKAKVGNAICGIGFVMGISSDEAAAIEAAKNQFRNVIKAVNNNPANDNDNLSLLDKIKRDKEILDYIDSFAKYTFVEERVAVIAELQHEIGEAIINPDGSEPGGTFNTNGIKRELLGFK